MPYPSIPYAPFAGALAGHLANTYGFSRPRPGRGSAVNTGTYAVRRYQKRRPFQRKNTLVKKIRSLEDAQHLTGIDSNLTQILTHNTIYTHNPTAQIVGGTSNSTRTGETVYLDAIKLRGTYSIASALTNGEIFRLLVLWADPDQDPGTGFGSGLGSTDLVVGTTGAKYITAFIPDPKKITVLYDMTYDVNHTVASVTDAHAIIDTVKVNKSFPYKPTTKFGKDRNLYIVVMGTTPGGTSGTTVVGTIDLNYDLIFRNSK